MTTPNEQLQTMGDDWLVTSQTKPKLLIIDDQPVNIRLIHQLFQHDFDVFMATSGEAGLAKCKQALPDIILLDIVMDGIDGFEVCRQLKTDPSLKHIPIIFITGQFNEQDEVKGFELGAVDFIHKPINPVITKARVSTQLKLKQQTDLLRNIALVDGLTSIANRRRFDSALQYAWRHCMREQQPLSLSIVDIDYFKQYNDHYGHLLGDSALRAVAQCLQRSANRPQDLVARVGGEEFAILLPNTPLQNVSVILDRAFAAIQNLAIAHTTSPLNQLTVSAGYACILPDGTATTEQLYQQADQALYSAKQNNRNQYQCFQANT